MDDLIQRQAVIDCFKKWQPYMATRLHEFEKELFELPSVKPQKWIPIEWKPFGKHGYPKPEDEYKHFLTVDNKGEITIQEFLLTLDEEPQPYFTGMRNVIAWMPLPSPYKGEKE